MVRYRPDLDPVLRGISFEVRGQEKVRTHSTHWPCTRTAPDEQTEPRPRPVQRMPRAGRLSALAAADGIQLQQLRAGGVQVGVAGGAELAWR